MFSSSFFAAMVPDYLKENVRLYFYGLDHPWQVYLITISKSVIHNIVKEILVIIYSDVNKNGVTNIKKW